LAIFTGERVPQWFRNARKLRGKDVLTVAMPAMTLERCSGRERPP